VGRLCEFGVGRAGIHHGPSLQWVGDLCRKEKRNIVEDVIAGVFVCLEYREERNKGLVPCLIIGGGNCWSSSPYCWSDVIPGRGAEGYLREWRELGDVSVPGCLSLEGIMQRFELAVKICGRLCGRHWRNEGHLLDKVRDAVLDVMLELMVIVRKYMEEGERVGQGRGKPVRLMLSHSGAQKQSYVMRVYEEVVAQKLCEDYQVFLDDVSLQVSDDSVLMMLYCLGECEVAHVTLTEEFLSSEWPVLELWCLFARWRHEGWRGLYLDLYETRPTGQAINTLSKYYLLPWTHHVPTMRRHHGGQGLRGSDTVHLKEVVKDLRELLSRSRNGERKFSVFIVHPGDAKTLSEILFMELSSLGILTFLDEKSLTPSMDCVAAMNAALDECSHSLLFFLIFCSFLSF